jgi:hypothetical protein
MPRIYTCIGADARTCFIHMFGQTKCGVAQHNSAQHSERAPRRATQDRWPFITSIDSHLFVESPNSKSWGGGVTGRGGGVPERSGVCRGTTVDTNNWQTGTDQLHTSLQFQRGIAMRQCDALAGHSACPNAGPAVVSPRRRTHENGAVGIAASRRHTTAYHRQGCLMVAVMAGVFLLNVIPGKALSCPDASL